MMVSLQTILASGFLDLSRFGSPYTILSERGRELDRLQLRGQILEENSGVNLWP